MAKRTKKADVDVEVDNCGTVAVVHLLTEQAREWWDENVETEPWQWLGAVSIGVEPRAGFAIVEAMAAEGFAVA